MRSLQCPVSIKAHVVDTKDQAHRTVITYVQHWRNAGTLRMCVALGDVAAILY